MLDYLDYKAFITSKLDKNHALSQYECKNLDYYSEKGPFPDFIIIITQESSDLG